jgi:hypothetical protein
VGREVLAVVGVVVAPDVHELLAERGAVRVEEGLVLGPGAHRREVALDHHGVGVERLDVGDGGPVHDLGVGIVTGRRPVDRVIVDTVEDSALDLAEVDVVHRRHRGQAVARRAGERSEVVAVEVVVGVRRQPGVLVHHDAVVEHRLVVGDGGQVHGVRRAPSRRSR